MDTDPWHWDVSEVQQFFQKDAAGFISDRPRGHLPPLRSFLQALHDNDVDGASLLNDIDPAALRDDFGISSFPIRSTILHCIRKLRSQSHTVRTRGAIAAPHTPTSITTPRLLPQPFGERKNAAQDPEPVGEKLRPGEDMTEDGTGRKRRKLHLSKPGPQLEGSALGGYLPNAGCAIDELFFGRSALGCEVGELLPAGIVVIEVNESSVEDDTFQFFGPQKSYGEAAFVDRRVRHFLSNRKESTVRRRNRDAVAIMPYPDRLKEKAHSAMVIQFREAENPIAVREQASMLDGGYTYEDEQQSSTGEWDFLLQRHKSKNDAECPVYGESDSGETESTHSSSDSQAEPMADVDDSSNGLGSERVDEIITSVIEQCVVRWTKQLPRLEEKRAWTVWKKMKFSRSVRDGLIAGANSRIGSLTGRLTKLKEELQRGTWEDEADLSRACSTLEATVEDREEQRWMISVWQRRKEPQRNGKPKTTAHKHSPNVVHSGVTATADQPFRVQQNDRLSVSPTLATRDKTAPAATGADPSDRGNSLANQYDEKSDFNQSQSPSGSPFVVPDDGTATGIEASDEKASGSETVGEGEESDNETALLEPIQTSPRDNVVLPPGSNTKAQSEDRLPLSSSKTSLPAVESDVEDLPSPSTFVPKITRPALPETPTNSRFGISTQPIDLTMTSSDEHSPRATSEASAPQRRDRRSRSLVRKGIDYTSNPDDATSAEIAEWDVLDLMRRGDRKRLLIKLLHNLTPRQREELYVSYQEMGQSKFTEQLRLALHSRSIEDAKGEDSESASFGIMSHCVRLAVAWLLCTPECLSLDYDNIPWQIVVKDPNQHSLFVKMLASLLFKKDSRMFASPRYKATSSLAHVVISDDDNSSHRASRRKRKRPVAESQSAAVVRQQAHDRQEKYKEAISALQTDGNQLEAMLASDPSRSDIEINPNKKRDHDPIYIHPNIARKMKAHQIEGVRFLWLEITSEEEDSEVGAQGCLLAHTMGLGKTMQTIALLVALEETVQSKNPRIHRQLPSRLRPKGLRGKRSLRVLILCPPALLQNWRREIGQWAGTRLGNIFTIESANKAISLLDDWHRHGGILLIGYSLFRSLCVRKDSKVDADASRTDKILLESAEVVVADEVHTLKSSASSVSAAARKFKTQSRIGLTGTPMSNDVQEIYALVSWVAPGYLGEPNEFKARYSEPIQEGTYADSSKWEVRKSIVKLTALRKEIEPKVNRADITVLRGSLKPKVEFVLFVPLTPVQVMAYKRCITALKADGDRVQNASQVTLFGWLAVLMLLTNHPLCFKRKLLTPPASRKKLNMRDQTPATDSGSATPLGSAEVTAQGDSTDAENAEAAVREADVHALGFTEAMINGIIEGLSDEINPSLSAKASIFRQILNHSHKCGDKMLVFSMSIPTLQYLDELLRSMSVRFGRIDGSTRMPARTQLLEDFHKDKFDVMLISTRAGGVGLNISGANRVVIFDFGFNPTWEEQAIGRAYRLGQTKPVFVYRFVASGTFEANIYNKQLFKTSLAQRVVDKKNPRRHAERNAREYLYEPKEVDQEDVSEWIGKDPHVLDKILEQHGSPGEGKKDTWIRGIKTMETLQEEVKDEPLTAEEELEVDLEIEQGRSRKTGRKAAMTTQSAFASQAPLPPPQQQAPNGYARPTQTPSEPQQPVFGPPRSLGIAMQAQQAPQDHEQQQPIGGLPWVPPSPRFSQRGPAAQHSQR